ncbi:MAG: ATP-binding protein [Candidatus Omnitrophica bacterium]|nr:ATP-binding protein [Candidatus Omnitrophota bacterium]
MKESTRNFNGFIHSLIESLPYGIMVLDHDDRIQELNRNFSFIFNINIADVKGKNYKDVIESKFVDVFSNLIEDTKVKGFVMDRQISVPILGGVEITIALSGSALKDKDNNFYGLTIICREMTATRELERMRELDKLKSDFISSVSHDLKTPLTSIIGYTDILMQLAKEKSLSEESDYLKIIMQEAMRFARMIDDIINMAKIESGKLQLKKELASLKEIVEEVIKIVIVQAEKFKFIVNFDNSIPLISIDKVQMKRVFLNLVSNAIKYSPQGGEIRIDGYTKGDNVYVDVIDHGIGMSEEALSHMFEKFYRVESDATKGITGTGLGLAITKGIIEAHGGTIVVRSKLGEGSTFSVIFPLTMKKII